MVQPRIGEGETVGMMVRMPADLRDRIKAAAETNGRSQNSEIVATLEEKYPAPEFHDISLAEIYEMMIRIGTADTDHQAVETLELTNKIMKNSGLAVKLEITGQTQPDGTREVILVQA